MVIINGKEVKLKLDFGAVKMLKREYGIDVFKLSDSDMQDIDIFTAILYALAKRGGNDITMDDVDSISFKDMGKITEGITGVMKEFAPEPEEGTEEPPLARKPRKPRK